MGSLEEIQAKKQYDTDKNSKHSYFLAYEEMFRPLKHEKINLLEIGVRSGGSLLLWHDYFTHPEKEIHGVEIDQVTHGSAIQQVMKVPGCYVHISDFRNFQTDQQYDIIIDDGSHTVADQVDAVKLFWKNLKPGGAFIIEDVADLKASQLLTVAGFKNTIVDLRLQKRRFDDMMIILRKD